MDTLAFIQHLKALSFYQDQIVHVESLSPRHASSGELDSPLPAPLQERLQALGMWPLYSHQAAALNALRRGSNVMVATPSASGKSLCYHLPVLESLLTDKRSRALYLFPTKALAQDQKRSLRELASLGLLEESDCATFDGDTVQEVRAEIKRRARIVLSNPDMLHLGILPNHMTWARFFQHLKYVVVDEAHVYRGVFGSHVACVLRRLRRVCARYGSNPRFILCSATTANPEEHAQKLVGLPFETIKDDGSPSGGKRFVFWNPPVFEKARLARRSANSEAAHLLAALVSYGIRSLVFTRTRKLTELVYVYAVEAIPGGKWSLMAQQISPYRGGYLPEERRRIEREFFSGKLRGLVATSAMELGVDVGGLDATVLTGYPGSVASAWQQAGRSGRRQTEALSILIGLDNPLDQYFMRHPEDFFHKSFEHALINPDNPNILSSHLLCAAWELSLGEEDERVFGSLFTQTKVEMEERGMLRRHGRRSYITPALSYPAQGVSIRSTSAQRYAIIESGQGAVLETVDSSVAFFQIHTGAVHLHMGEPYLITRLDLPSRTAYAVPTDVPYYTQTKDITDVRVIRPRQQKRVGEANVFFGEVKVTTEVLGFRKKVQFTEEVLGEEFLDLPVQCFDTMALWFDLPAQSLDRVSRAQLDLAGGLHAAEHAAIAMLPLFALCDRNDIGGVSTVFHPDTGHAQIFIYDAHPGGIGIAEKGFELVRDLWQVTLKAVQECPCEEGCPSCVHSPKCGNNNQPLDKKAAELLLEGLLA